MIRLLLAISFLCLAQSLPAQKTTITDIGKVGKLQFSITKSDTSAAVSITQSGYDTRIVIINQSEIDEVIQTLNKFIDEMDKKATDKTVITYNVKSLLLSCSYFKQTGWSVMIQNTDPAFDKNSETVQRKIGYVINSFVEIKPEQLSEVVKIFSRLIDSKAI